MRLHLLLSLLLLLSLSAHTALAQVIAPSQGGEVSLVLVTSTTIEIEFGTTGTGQGRVVAVAPTSNGMPVPLVADEGKFYNAAPLYGKGSPLGDGFVVYNGTGHSTTITGLKPGSYYYFTDAEYNTDGTTIAYNTYGTSMSTTTRPASVTLVPTPLPVELLTFTGIVDYRNLATLNWTTATEQNTAYFALERSSDGTVYNEIGRIAAAGTSSLPLGYQWLDNRPLESLTYYRLRQVDQDGIVRYSKAISLSPVPHASVVQSIDIYPNPIIGQTIQLLLKGYKGELFQLSLSDAVGRTIISQKLTPVETQYLIALPLPQYIASGTYILTFTGSGRPIQKRITVSN